MKVYLVLWILGTPVSVTPTPYTFTECVRSLTSIIPVPELRSYPTCVVAKVVPEARTLSPENQKIVDDWILQQELKGKQAL